METGSDDVSNHSNDFKDSEDETSFVTRVKSRVSGLLNSSISRIFGSQDKRSPTIRRRDDYDTLENQPPCKKARGSDDTSFSFNTFQKNDNVNNSLSRNNLSNASTSTLFTNFVEPVAGPSGVRTQKDLHKILTSSSLPHHEVNNVEKDSDSGESTSGYSSMARIYNKGTSQASDDPKSLMSLDRSKLTIGDQKNNPQSKMLKSKKLFESSSPDAAAPNSNNNRSLFTDQSLSPQTKNASLSSRRPSFNTSNFGSPHFVDRTLTTSRIVNSPFYNGPTTYGGASAYVRHPSAMGSRRQQQQQSKNSFSVKPINKNSSDVDRSCASLSKTARRILETLEQYSSAVTMATDDAKKIPLPTKVERNGNRGNGGSNHGNGRVGMLSKYVGSHPYSSSARQNNNMAASNRELLVPTMPELLKMKQKQRLQDTTDKIRKIANNNNNNNSSSTVAAVSQESEQQKYTGKMKSKITSVRQRAPPATIEVIEDVVLEPVALKLPENRLPKFDLVIPPPECLKNDAPRDSFKSCVVESKPPPITAIVGSATSQNVETTTKEKYTFSKPLIIGDHNLKSIAAMNNFKFSEPLPCKKIRLENKEETSKKIEIVIKEKNNGDSNATNKTATSEETKKKDVVIVDPLMMKFKAPAGAWECSTCLIRNKAEAVKCAACETLRAKKEPTTATTSQQHKSTTLPNFGAQFARKADEWDCAVCLVRNRAQNERCAACDSPNAVAAPKTNGFGAAFLLRPETQWECAICLVRNKTETNKCVACGASRGGVGDDKKCDSCWTRKKVVVDFEECDSCKKRRAEVLAGDNSSNNNNNNSKFGAKFKPPADTWECDTCLIRNKNDARCCAACQTPREKVYASVVVDNKNAGVVKSTSNNGGKWECPTCMVRNEDKMEKCPCCETPKPGVTLVSKSTVNMFNFGVNKSQFNFGIPKDHLEKQQQLKSTTSSTTAPSNAAPTISFNSSSGNDASKTTTTTTPVFTFGVKPSVDDDAKTKKITEEKKIVVEGANKTVVEAATPTPAPEKPKEMASFKFGVPDSASKKSDNESNKVGVASPQAFQFNKPSEKTTTTTGFGAATTAVKFGFGASSTTANAENIVKPTPSTAPLFKFEAPKTAATVTPVVVSNNNNSSTPGSFSASKNDNNNKPQTNNNLFAFGKSNAAMPAPSASSPSSGFSFGKSDATAGTGATKTPLFAFGGTAPAGAPGGFSFAPSTQQQKVESVKSPVAAGGFSFQAPKGGGGGLFAAPQATGGLFAAPAGATTTAPAFPKNGGFNFGNSGGAATGANSNNNSQAAVFTFGANPSVGAASAAAGQGQATSGGFNFSAPAPSAGGFNFTAPTFDANTKPNFQFTGGAIPTFAATPTEGGGVVPKRKIKKACRRAAQR